MEDQRLIPSLILLALIMAGSCEPVLADNAPKAVPEPKTAQMTLKGRGRGNKLLKLTPETIQAEGCSGKRLPFFRLMASEVHPAKVSRGGSFNHRFTYALCPEQPNATAKASLIKRISLGSAVLLDANVASYLLRPGTWADDDEIDVPLDAPSGRYAIEIEITVNQAVQRTRAEFLVD